MIGEDYDDLLVTTDADVADRYLAEFILIHDFWSGSAAGVGRIEYLNVGGTSNWFNDVVWGL
ncbi:MAG TPA: hypothetical protein VD995_25415 [Azospirillum sp.]|nr:hypothetical protein [Azospirillum sp.]